MHYTRTLGAALMATTVLSGCAIKPEPIDADARLAGMMKDQSEIYSKQEPISQPLTFYDALARALKYNFENRLAMMEAVLQDTQLSVATLNMLPRLTASAGYLGPARSTGVFQPRRRGLTKRPSDTGAFDLAGYQPRRGRSDLYLECA